MEYLDDKKLIDEYLKGSQRAFEQLYGKYRNKLFWYIREILNCQESDAKDIFSETWFKAIKSLTQYTNKGYFLSWLQMIAKNILIDKIRKEQRKGVHISIDNENMPDFAIDNSQPLYFEFAEYEKRDNLKDIIEKLPDAQKRVVKLRLDNYSFKDIAKLEKCSINTALSRMNYAKNYIKSSLVKGGIYE